MSGANYLLLISIGPVQEFIASSRKLRDLWCGSYLLSDFSRATANALLSCGCELIFPAPGQMDSACPALPDDMSVANKILAITQGDPAAALKRAKDSYQSNWRIVAEKAFSRLPATALVQDRFESQITDFGEFYACWTVLGSDYAESRRRLEQILSGRKGLRQFEKPGWNGVGLPKSSLDGVRETVIQRRGPLEKRFLLKKGEHLDALGIVKRMVPLLQPEKVRPHFDNLAQVAVRDYLDGIARDPKARTILAPLLKLDGVFIETFPVCRHGYDFLPADFPVELFLTSERKAWIESEETTANGYVHLIDTVMKDLKHHTKRDPTPYCCLLVGDGDHMGKTLDQLKEVDAHRSFSEALDGFARSMQGVVAQFGGRLVYSGGDDVMAYVPMHTALACAKTINHRFESAMKEALAGRNISLPTFSMGMVIVHQASPLNRSLDLARSAERTAKEAGGRAALAITQSKRSGSDITVCGKWQGDGGAIGIVERIESLVVLYDQEILSSRLGYQLRKLVDEGGRTIAYATTDSGRLVPQNAASSETLRLIGRKQTQEGHSMGEAQQRALLAGQNDLRTMADEMVIARQFAEAQKLASAGWL